jgi:hypothetical protein
MVAKLPRTRVDLKMRDTKLMCELSGRGGEVDKPCLYLKDFFSHN